MLYQKETKNEDHWKTRTYNFSFLGESVYWGSLYPDLNRKYKFSIGSQIHRTTAALSHRGITPPLSITAPHNCSTMGNLFPLFKLAFQKISIILNIYIHRKFKVEKYYHIYHCPCPYYPFFTVVARISFLNFINPVHIL